MLLARCFTYKSFIKIYIESTLIYNLYKICFSSPESENFLLNLIRNSIHDPKTKNFFPLNLETLSWMWRRRKCGNHAKVAETSSTQCNSWCLFITFYKIIKSLCLAGASCCSRAHEKAKIFIKRSERKFLLSSLLALFAIFDLAISFYFMSLRLLNVCSLNWYSYFIHPLFPPPSAYHHYERHRCWFSASFTDTAKAHTERIVEKLLCSDKKCFDMLKHMKRE